MSKKLDYMHSFVLICVANGIYENKDIQKLGKNYGFNGNKIWNRIRYLKDKNYIKGYPIPGYLNRVRYELDYGIIKEIWNRFLSKLDVAKELEQYLNFEDHELLSLITRALTIQKFTEKKDLPKVLEEIVLRIGERIEGKRLNLMESLFKVEKDYGKIESKGNEILAESIRGNNNFQTLFKLGCLTYKNKKLYS